MLAQLFLFPLLPKAGSFVAHLPGGGRVELLYNEALGQETLIYGGFEKAEIEWFRNHVRKGSTVIDIGGNIGLFSVALAYMVGDEGKVLTFEPVRDNIDRLHHNLELNALQQVAVYNMALGDHEGKITLHCAKDGAFTSAIDVPRYQQNGKAISVPLAKLDQIWREAGSPLVAAIKIDVEGSELGVLKGASELLMTCKPLILIEANTHEQLTILYTALSDFGYRYSQPPGFCSWNYVFQTNKV